MQNPSSGTERAPVDEASSTVAPEATSGGSASPAGDEVATLPPTVPRLRIWGDPTVREAIARPGRTSAISRTTRA